MFVKRPHDFSLSISEMYSLQKDLSKKIVQKKLEKEPKLIAGFDVSYEGNLGLGVIALFEYPSINLLKTYTAVVEANFPYIPGFLSFRELPVFIKTAEKIEPEYEPDIFVFDGNGLIHPRKLGLASHASFFVTKPTFGIAKSLLIGKYEEPGPNKGDFSYIRYRGKIIGAALRSKESTKPVFVSVGNRITLYECIEITKKALDGYRIPKLTRLPDQISRMIKRKLKNEFGTENESKDTKTN